MIKIITMILLVLSLIGCGGDNAYDGNSAVNNTTPNTSSSIEGLHQVLISDASNSLLKANELVLKAETLENNVSLANLQTTQEAFKEFISTWKAVQSLYVAGDIDTAMIDIELFMDLWHSGNEDIKVQLDTVFTGSADIEASLFRNSNKTVGAIEYTLFGNAELEGDLLVKFSVNTNRRASALVVMVKSVQAYSKQISEFYSSDTDFIRDDEASVENLVNQIIDSAYKLKEWRVGDAGGFVIKYKDNPNASRLEYVDSSFSAEAIEAILKSHKNLFDPISQDGLSAYMRSKNASVEASFIVGKIDVALLALLAIPKPMKSSVPSAELTALYTALNEVYDAYYISLVSALNIVPALPEADGD